MPEEKPKNPEKEKKSKWSVVLAILVITIIITVAMLTARYYDRVGPSAKTVVDRDSPTQNVQPAPVVATPALPTRSNPAHIEVGTSPVELPIYVPPDKVLCIWGYSGKNYSRKDKNWNYDIPVRTGVTNSTGNEHIFEPVVWLIDVPPGTKTQLYYCVE